MKILSSAIVSASVPLFRLDILECFEPLSGIKLVRSCPILCSFWPTLAQNGQLWLIIMQHADNNIVVLLTPMFSADLWLFAEHHFPNGIMPLSCDMTSRTPALSSFFALQSLMCVLPQGVLPAHP